MILSDSTLLPKGVKVIAAISWFADRKAGYSLKEGAPLEHVKQSRISILFIRGKKDKTVPVENAFLDLERYWDKFFPSLMKKAKTIR